MLNSKWLKLLTFTLVSLLTGSVFAQSHPYMTLEQAENYMKNRHSSGSIERYWPDVRDDSSKLESGDCMLWIYAGTSGLLRVPALVASENLGPLDSEECFNCLDGFFASWLEDLEFYIGDETIALQRPRGEVRQASIDEVYAVSGTPFPNLKKKIRLGLGAEMIFPEEDSDKWKPSPMNPEN